MSSTAIGEIRSKLNSNYIRKCIEPIVDPVYEDSYEACLLELDSGNWFGYIQYLDLDNYIANIKGQAQTKKELIVLLTDKLHEAIELEENEHDRRLLKAIEAGAFDSLAEKSEQNVREGKYYDWETLKEMLVKHEQ